MSKFQVGDTVRCIDDSNQSDGLNKKDAYTIRRVYNDGPDNMVDLSDPSGRRFTFWFERRFEKYVPTLKDIQAGDTLEHEESIATVLARINDVVIISADGTPNVADTYLHVDELTEYGYALPSPVKEMTVAEIEKLVGTKVKIVKE